MNKRSILIVEDDLFIRQLIEEFLVDEGYEVQTANNGLMALKSLDQPKELPGLILLDLMMPEMDGSEFRKRQQSEPRWAGIPTILMSADGRVEEHSKELGTEGFLKKPLELESILSQIKIYCE